MNKLPYQCTECEMRFATESRYLKHECKQMKRQGTLKETDGQAAWLYYQKWMTAYNRHTPNADAFLNSRYFNSFVKFADFVKKTRIVDVDVYIEVMKDKDITPPIWTNDQVYALYIEHLDKNLTPQKQAEITIDTLFNYADEGGVEVKEVFSILTPNQVIQLIRERRLSPWILLNSIKFRDFLQQSTDEQRAMIYAIIGEERWKKKFNSFPEVRKQMKLYVKELEL